MKDILNHPGVTSLVFSPQKRPAPINLPSNIEILKLQINEEILIGGFLFKNDPTLPTILFFHGNGELAIDYQYIAPQFFKCGVNLAVVDFRGYGFSSGNPYYTSLIDDALPIFSEFTGWIEKAGFQNSLFVQGRSLGSVCASEIGAQNPKNLSGIIIESGFASLNNFATRYARIEITEKKPLSFSEYSNDTRARKFKKPTLIIHGSTDMIIPSSQGELFFENLPEHIEKQLVMIEKAGHNTVLSPKFEEKYFLPLENFIRKYK